MERFTISGYGTHADALRLLLNSFLSPYLQLSSSTCFLASYIPQRKPDNIRPVVAGYMQPTSKENKTNMSYDFQNLSSLLERQYSAISSPSPPIKVGFTEKEKKALSK